MLRISITFFYELGARIRPLANLKAGQKIADVWSALYSAETQMEGLFNADWFLPAVRSSYQPGQLLLQAIKAITSQTEWEQQVSFMEAYAVTSSLSNFEGALRAELHVTDTYFVTRKGGYETAILVSNAEQMFPSDLGKKVPSAIPDVRDAGKCLAYEASTAAGFHAFRAVEAVLRRYWEVVSGGQPHPEHPNIGVYLKLMDDKLMGDANVRAVLRQIKDLHRNPINHPEKTLTLEEASGTFGIAASAIGAMLKAIPEPTSPATSSLLAGALSP